MRQSVLILALCIFVFWVMPFRVVQAENAIQVVTCSRRNLDRPPGWTNSGEWTASGDALLVADALRKTILQYPLSNSKVTKVLTEPISPILQRLAPSMLRAQGGKLYVEISDDRILSLDRSSYSLLGKRSLNARSTHGGSSLAGMFMWEPVGSDMIAFSDVKELQDRWSSAFVRFPADKPQEFETLRSYQFRDPTKTFYRLGHPYIAAIGDVGYILLMDSKMGIYRSKPRVAGLEPLAAFPDKLEISPILPSFTTADDLAPVMRAVERSVIPTGLYGWEGALYVLAREPRKSGGTKWWLTKIDPQADRVVDSIEVPTTAHHLTVVPGKKAWAFIEKGPVEGFGRQKIGSILFAPAARLRGENLPSMLCTTEELAHQ